MAITIEHLTHHYGSTPSVTDLNLEIADGEFLVLLGPSGCGKTTTMRCIVGLETPTTGRITIDGRTVFDSDAGTVVATNKRRIGMVFQSYAVWPHMTVFQNLAYSMRIARKSKQETAERVRDVAELVGLTPLLDRGATALSGGQMQRLALGRSLVMQPNVLLLDEPLSNLDARLRERLRVELKELQQRLGFTAVYVTHDQQEALALADRIAVMNQGVIEQLDHPTELYRRPCSSFVADFMGIRNILPSTVDDIADGHVTVHVGDTAQALMLAAATFDEPPTIGDVVTVVVRSEAFQLIDGPTLDDASSLTVTVAVASFLGAYSVYQGDTDAGTRIEFVLSDDQPLLPAGARVTLALPRTGARVLKA